jgi:Holliday junction resolvase RusA-like endonuclease
MKKVDIKPLSVNLAWKGRRFKTNIYKKYEKDLLLILPEMKIPEGDFSVVYEFGFSNRLSDWDNPIKPFQDILQKRYDFDDSRIVSATVAKVVVKKGCEYIKFNIEGANNG